MYDTNSYGCLNFSIFKHQIINILFFMVKAPEASLFLTSASHYKVGKDCWCMLRSQIRIKAPQIQMQ